MTIEEQIKKYISSDLLYSDNGFPCGDEDSLLDNGIIDSIGIMQLVLFIDETYHISIHDEEITPMNFDSIARLATYVRSKTALMV